MSTLSDRNHSRRFVDCRDKTGLGRGNPENRKRRIRRRKGQTAADKDTVHPSLRLSERTLKQGKNPRRVHGLHRNSELHAESRQKRSRQLVYIENIRLSLKQFRIKQTTTRIFLHRGPHRKDSVPVMGGLPKGHFA